MDSKHSGSISTIVGLRKTASIIALKRIWSRVEYTLYLCACGLAVELDLAKVGARVRFPAGASSSSRFFFRKKNNSKSTFQNKNQLIRNPKKQIVVFEKKVGLFCVTGL